MGKGFSHKSLKFEKFNSTFQLIENTYGRDILSQQNKEWIVPMLTTHSNIDFGEENFQIRIFPTYFFCFKWGLLLTYDITHTT